MENLDKVLKEIEDIKINEARHFSHLQSEAGHAQKRGIESIEEARRIEKDLRGIIYGNGKVGMTIEIDRLKQKTESQAITIHEMTQEIKTLSDYKKVQEGTFKTIMWFVGIGVAILVGIVIVLATSK